MSDASFHETERPADRAYAETSRSERPAADWPSFEIPAAFRAWAEKGTSQARDNWEKLKVVTDEATGAIEDSYAGASRGAAAIGLKMIEVSRANTNAAFDYAAALLAVTTLSEAVELSGAHLRRQVEALGAQSKDFAALAQKVATETARPIQQGVGGAFKTAA